MSRGFFRIVVVLFLAALGGATWLWWPTETRRINHMFEQLAADASFRPGEGNLSRLAKVQAIANRFTPDATVRFETLGVSEREVNGRDEIRGVAMLSQNLAQGLAVKIFDQDVTFGTEPGTARVNLTATATSGKQEAFNAQEFLFQLVKREGKWFIQSAETVKTLRH